MTITSHPSSQKTTANLKSPPTKKPKSLRQYLLAYAGNDRVIEMCAPL